MPSKKVTNTLIVLLSRAELLEDEFFDTLTSKVNGQNETEYIKFIKLPSLQRVIITFETHHSSATCFEMLQSQNYKVSFSAVDTKIPESTFLQLPDQGKKYIISPPPSPPVGWVERPEDGPNMKVIHNHKELTGLLFKRLGHRIEQFDGDDEENEEREDNEDKLTHGGITLDDFINENGQLEVPKVLVDELNGNPVIILDPPPNPRFTDGKNEDGISVNRIKTPMPPPPPLSE